MTKKKVMQLNKSTGGKSGAVSRVKSLEGWRNWVCWVRGGIKQSTRKSNNNLHLKSTSFTKVRRSFLNIYLHAAAGVKPPSQKGAQFVQSRPPRPSWDTKLLERLSLWISFCCREPFKMLMSFHFVPGLYPALHIPRESTAPHGTNINISSLRAFNYHHDLEVTKSAKSWLRKRWGVTIKAAGIMIQGVDKYKSLITILHLCNFLSSSSYSPDNLSLMAFSVNYEQQSLSLQLSNKRMIDSTNAFS